MHGQSQLEERLSNAFRNPVLDIRVIILSIFITVLSNELH